MRYYIRAYYGPGGRKGGKRRPGECEGDLAIEVWHDSKSGKEIEIQALRRREDIGIIIESKEEK